MVVHPGALAGHAVVLHPDGDAGDDRPDGGDPRAAGAGPAGRGRFVAALEIWYRRRESASSPRSGRGAERRAGVRCRGPPLQRTREPTTMIRTAERSPRVGRPVRPRSNGITAFRLFSHLPFLPFHAWPIGGFGPDPPTQMTGGSTWRRRRACSGRVLRAVRLPPRRQPSTSRHPHVPYRRAFRILPAYWMVIAATAFVVGVWYFPSAGCRSPASGSAPWTGWCRSPDVAHQCTLVVTVAEVVCYTALAILPVRGHPVGVIGAAGPRLASGRRARGCFRCGDHLCAYDGLRAGALIRSVGNTCPSLVRSAWLDSRPPIAHGWHDGWPSSSRWRAPTSRSGLPAPLPVPVDGRPVALAATSSRFRSPRSWSRRVSRRPARWGWRC